MGKKQSKRRQDDPNSRLVCRNRKARHNYEILDELECGIVLKGSEVKSVRSGKVTIDEAFARMKDGELWLIACNIAEYPQANVMNHEPTRPRKLLLQKRQLQKFAESATQQGLTLIPLSMYFSRGFVKVKIAIARGRKLYDKREKLKKESARRDISQAMGARR